MTDIRADPIYRSVLHGWNARDEMDSAILFIRQHRDASRHIRAFARSWMDPKRTGKVDWSFMNFVSGTLAFANIFSRWFGQSPYYNVATGLIIMAFVARMWRNEAALSEIMNVYTITMKNSAKQGDHVDKVDATVTGHIAMIPVLAEIMLHTHGESLASIVNISDDDDSLPVKLVSAALIGQLYSIIIDRNIEASQIQQWVIDYVDPVSYTHLTLPTIA